MRTHFLIPSLFVVLVFAPNGASAQSREDHAQVQQNDGQQAHAEYHFRSENGRLLREQYPDWSRVDIHHRGNYVAGGTMPDGWRSRVAPVPIEIVRELPPPPPGYAFGYVDGYCVAYDPTSLRIADAIDLATFETESGYR